MTLQNLQDLLGPVWGPEQPKTLVELIHADYRSLDERAKAIRGHAVELVHSFERQPVLNARLAREALERHHLPCRKGLWNTIVLDEKRERIYDRASGTRMRMRHATSKSFPDIARLTEKAPLPENGQYLIIYGGGIDALDERSLRAYRRLKNEAVVADVLLWETTDDTATFWSVRTGCGSQGSARIEFPDNENLRRWQES